MTFRQHKARKVRPRKRRASRAKQDESNNGAEGLELKAKAGRMQNAAKAFRRWEVGSLWRGKRVAQRGSTGPVWSRSAVTQKGTREARPVGSA